MPSVCCHAAGEYPQRWNRPRPPHRTGAFSGSAPSNYEEGNMKAKLRVIRSYTDVKLNQDLPIGHEFTVDRKRAEELLSNPNHLVELVEYVEEQPKVEKAVKPKKKVEKR